MFFQVKERCDHAKIDMNFPMDKEARVFLSLFDGADDFYQAKKTTYRYCRTTLILVGTFPQASFGAFTLIYLKTFISYVPYPPA